MTTYPWKFAALTLLMVGTAACRTDHGNNLSAAETTQPGPDSATASHAPDKDAAAKR